MNNNALFISNLISFIPNWTCFVLYAWDLRLETCNMNGSEWSSDITNVGTHSRTIMAILFANGYHCRHSLNGLLIYKRQSSSIPASLYPVYPFHVFIYRNRVAAVREYGFMSVCHLYAFTYASNMKCKVSTTSPRDFDFYDFCLLLFCFLFH